MNIKSINESIEIYTRALNQTHDRIRSALDNREYDNVEKFVKIARAIRNALILSEADKAAHEAEAVSDVLS